MKCVLPKVLRAPPGLERVGLHPGPVCVWDFRVRETGVEENPRASRLFSPAFLPPALSRREPGVSPTAAARIPALAGR